jgi:hypothetical protein
MDLSRSLRRLRVTAAALSPRRRRWQRFLNTLPIDPDDLPRPLDAPDENDFIICGSPRTGTTLACAVLYQPPRVVTVMEPWDGMRLSPAALFDSLRQEIDQTGCLRRGKLDVTALMKEGAVRWCNEGHQSFETAVEPGYRLGVKWPAFWRYLDLLPRTKFVLCLRNPIETIASYKYAGGRVAEGLNYDTAFNRTMNGYLESVTRDPALRRVLLFDYIHERVLPHLNQPNVFALRYERWFTEREALTRELNTFLGVELGPGRPVLQRRRAGPALEPAEVELIRARCATADAIGYPLS